MPVGHPAKDVPHPALEIVTARADREVESLAFAGKVLGELPLRLTEAIEAAGAVFDPGAGVNQDTWPIVQDARPNTMGGSFP